ncbi:tetratricopeptide repeat protein [uncultured Roseovarius sp.]|uniref:alpha/beta fold hydrolase n=1 Tax=uncultured Roseovarius sp. TaxID=293344 RepID=UPI002617EA3E|nr:tetratricopeptide repeat protein [uncultured Roseovarius sp.]
MSHLAGDADQAAVPAPYPSALSGPSFHVLPSDDPNARRLVIFFAAKDLSFDRFNFFQLGRELPEHRMFVNNGSNDWYQSGVPGLGADFTDCVAMLRAWQGALGAAEICTVGTSMGAYGAIQYGAALGARVLAFASESRLGMPHSRSARYYTASTPPVCPDLRPALTKGTADVTLFVGERDPVDLCAASELAAMQGVRAYSLVGCAHIVPTFLSRQSRLGPLLRAFVAGEALPDLPAMGRALEVPGYVAAVREAHEAAQAAEWPLAGTAARRALGLLPFGEAAEFLLGQALLRQGATADAVDLLARNALSQPPDDNEALLLLAAGLRRLGCLERAMQVYQRMLISDPGEHRALFGLSMIHEKQGNIAQAMALIARALRINPRHGAYRKRYKALRARR